MVNINSIGQHVIQFKNGIMINANVSVKSIACVKKVIAGIIANVFVKMVHINPI